MGCVLLCCVGGCWLLVIVVNRNLLVGCVVVLYRMLLGGVV